MKKKKTETIIIVSRVVFGYNLSNKINFLTHFKALRANKKFSIIEFDPF